MTLTDRCAGETPITTSANALPPPAAVEPAQLDRRVEPTTAGDGDLASSADDRSMSTSTFRRPRRRRQDHETETNSAATSVRLEPPAARDQAGENGKRAREVAREMERVRQERIASVSARGPQRHGRPRGVDGDDQPTATKVHQADRPRTRARPSAAARSDADPDAHEKRKPASPRAARCSAFACPYGWSRQPGERKAHRKEGQQRGHEVGARVRRCGSRA